MSNKYLDINGLSKFWEAIKTYVGGKIKQANWTQTDSTADDYIKSKPAISASEGAYSIKESGASIARGDYSHVEGFHTSTDTTADYSHVEGYESSARGIYSHAEGYSTRVWGTASHSEGWATKALGSYSHAQNNNTIAANTSQTAIGKYNEEDTETDAALQKAFIIGNGTSTSDRSNAYAIDWQGDSDQQGRATTRDMTQEELDEFLSDLPEGGPSNYVKKSGDTMTGNLHNQASDIDASKTNNNISEIRYPTTSSVLDSQGRIIACQEGVIYPNGNIGWNIYAKNYNTSGEQIAQKGIAMAIDKSGNTSYSISEPQKFAEALGQGTKITPTFRQCTNGAYTTCRKIGNLVILSFNIEITTATDNYDYLTGLPNAVEGFAGSSAIGTWWVTTTGTLRFDGTPTVGWHNGNIVYICQ